MIKFFRKIRQRLLTENKFSKYLIYAIGEIILVVIGILIALQLNTWKNNNDQLELEIIYLKELEKNLTFNLEEEIISAIEYTHNKMQTYESFVDEVENYPNGVSGDSIRTLLDWWSPWELQINMAAFNNLNSIGIDVISNHDLRTEITQLYGFDMPRSVDHNKNNWMWNHQEIFPLFHDNLNTMNDSLTASDIEFLKTDLRAINRMRVHQRFYLRGTIWRLEGLRPKAESTLKNIRNEIARLEE